MKKSVLFIFLFVLVFIQSCTVKKIKDLSSLTIESDAVITIAEANKTRFVGPKDMVVDVEDGKLTISGGNSESVATLFIAQEDANDLESLTLLGNANIYCDTLHLSNDDLKIMIKNDGMFAGFIKANNVSITMENNAEMIVGGSGDNLTLVMSGKSKYTCPSLEWNNADVTVSDTAKCTIKVLKKLTVNASGEANLGYIGVSDSSITVSGNANVFKFPVSNLK
jgi:hypothetical protein